MSEEQPWLAKIHLDGGTLTLLPGWRWQADAEILEFARRRATFQSVSYEYSPADGAPGARLAGMVAAKIGGEVELPPPDDSPEEPGKVY